LFLRVSDGCGAGSSVRIVPSSAGTVIKTARASDGEAAAVVVAPHQPTFKIAIRQPNGSTKMVKVRLGSLQTTTHSSPAPSR
jgi:hypothetical protein